MADFSDISAEISSLMEEIDGIVPAPKPRVVEKAVPETSLQEAMNRVQSRKDAIKDYSYINSIAEDISNLDSSGFHNNNDITLDPTVDLTDRYISAIKRDENVEHVEIDTHTEARFAALTRQIMSVSNTVNTISENTIVSGIGHGAFGQAPGGGAARIRDQDDVNLDGLVNGDTLVWDSTDNQFKPGEAGSRPPIYDGTDNEPIVHPGYDIDSDESVLREFDVWLDSEGVIHYYYNDKWNSASVYTENVLPASGDGTRKFITTPNGETFDNQKEYNEWLYTRTDRRPIIDDTPPTIHPDFPNDPLRKGDFWIDSTNSKLYYYEGNVWEPIAGSDGRNPIFANSEPVLHPDYDPDTEDAELVVGDIWYDSDDNFKQYIYDGTDWIHPQDDHREAFTRFYEVVDDALYNSGNNATMSLGVADKASLDTVTSIKLSGTDGTDKVRYLFKQHDKLVIEDIRNGAYATYSVTSVVSSGEYTVVYENGNGITSAEFGVTFSVGNVPSDNIVVSDTAPAQAVNGTLWFDSSEDSLTLFMYYDPNEDPTEAAWIPAAPPVSLDGINATIKSALVVQSSILDRLNSGETTQSSIQDQVDLRLPLSGGVLTGGLSFERGDKDYNQFKISPNGGIDYNTNIYSLYGGQMRLRTSHTENEADYNTHIILNPDENYPETKIYNVVTPTQDHMAANKEYVDEAVATVGGGSSVPVGTVVMWFGTNAPSGWLKCDGSSFNTTTYSALHTHLGSVPNYTSGTLPNFQGLYPGGAGFGHDNALTSGGEAKTNTYHVPKTGKPASGSPYENKNRPNSNKDGFNGAGGTKALIDAGITKVTIDSGWDTVTRPPTLSIHFIIKAN
jgi:hypothetical protein